MDGWIDRWMDRIQIPFWSLNGVPSLDVFSIDKDFLSGVDVAIGDKCLVSAINKCNL